MRIIEFGAPTEQTITIVLYIKGTDTGVNIGEATERTNSKTTYTINIPNNITSGTYRLTGLSPNGRVLVNGLVEIGSEGIFTVYDIALSEISGDSNDSVINTIKRGLRNTTIIVNSETKVLGPCKDKDQSNFDISKVRR